MATVDYTKGGATKPPSNALSGVHRLDLEIDFSENSADSGDVLQIFDVPAKSFVVGVGYEVLTAEGATLTFDIGLTGTDVDGFIDGANGNAVGSGVSMAPALVDGAPNTLNPAYGLGKYFAVTDTIDVLLNNDADAAKIRFSLFFIFNG